ncbi:MAG: VCBS repeat-containing protein [Myxococcales bacterium]|nr:VCBS repeat-containing protein [Myxococcales bacterium]
MPALANWPAPNRPPAKLSAIICGSRLPNRCPMEKSLTISLSVDGKDLGTQPAVIEADGSAVAQFAAAALSEGPHTCEIAAKAGTSQVNATRPIVIDHTAPVVKIKSPLPGLFTGWVAIEVTSTDLHLASVTGKMGTKVLGSVKAESNWATMLKLPQQVGGAAELVLQATDKAGNVGNAAVSLTILAPPAFLQAETPFAGADGEGTPPAPANPANSNLTAAMTDGHAADMDGDGNTDILVATSTGITICYGTGKGMLIETPVYAGEPASSVRALDTQTVPVTGFEPATTHSGRLALARLTVSNKSSLALFVAVGRKLALVHKLPLETEIGHTLVLPSMDGKLTVVAAATNKEAPTLLVGTLQAPTDLQWSGGSAKSGNGQPLLSSVKKLAGVADIVHMRAGDVTGDGHADLIFGRSGPSVVTVCLNNGAQGFATCKDTLIAGETKPIDAIAVKTKNSQGADLLVAGQTTSSLFYLKNDGKGNFSVIGRVALANPPISLDVMLATAGGGGGAQAVVSSDACSVQMIDLELLAQGGVLDLTLACRAGYVTAGTPSFVVSGDFNGDGVSDMFVANGGTAGADMMMSNGTGLSATLDFPLCIRDKAQTGTVPTALAVADFEQDGKPDLIVAGSVTYSMVQKCGGTEDSPIPDFASPLLLYRDAGFGSHKLPAYTEYSPHADGVSTATTACGGSVKAIKAMLPTDADGDGRPDLAVILEGNYALTVGAGDPACGFNETHEVDSHFGMAYAPACALESAIEPKGPNQGAPYSRTTAAIFRNHPTKGLGFPATAAAVGKPPPPWFTFAAGLAPLALAVGDVDSDGKPDLVTLLSQVGDGSQKDFLPPRARVFRNTGAGFAPIPQVGEFTITPPGSSKLLTYKGT